MASRAPRCLLAVLLGSLALLVGCGEAEGPDGGEPPKPTESESDSPEGASAEALQIEAQRIEELSAIGYLAGTERADPESENPTGVVHHDPARVQPGVNLLTSGHGPVALLLDMQGEVLHRWRAEFGDVFPQHPDRDRAIEPHRNFWRDAVLFPNGDLLVVWELFGLFKLDRDSRVLWAVPEPAHHEIQVTDDGTIVHLEAERTMIPGIPEKRAIEDYVVVRDPGGRELRRLALSDVLRSADWLELRRRFWARSLSRGYGLKARGLYDPFHTNSLRLLSEREASRLGESFRAGDALVSMAMLDTIAIVDLERGSARWWQQGPWGMQHQPQPTPDGQIVLFNNFRAPDRSSVVTLDPKSGEVVREYLGPEDAPLYSRRSGRVQVLANENLLIVETDGGRALEITKDGVVVWQYQTPFRAGKEGELVANLYSLERLDASRAEFLTQPVR